MWEGLPVYVVEDTAEQLVIYVPEGAEIGFVDGDWPTADGKHPWHGKTHWEGHGCLQVQRPGDAHAVWHFWIGPDREFLCWYINLQADFVRTSIGYDTQDLELDLVVFPDGSHLVKDLELLDDRVAEGRFTAELVTWIRELGADLGRELDAGRHWWDPSWAQWKPPATWKDRGSRRTGPQRPEPPTSAPSGRDRGEVRACAPGARGGAAVALGGGRDEAVHLGKRGELVAA